MRTLIETTVMALLLIGFCATGEGATPLDNDKVQKTLTKLLAQTVIEVEGVALLDFSSVPGRREPQRDGVIPYFEDLHRLKFKLGPGVAQHTVTYAATGIPLEKALSAILTKCDCDYSIMPDGTILIQANPPKKAPEEEKSSPKAVEPSS
jgi:hypothetical protein